MKPGKALHVARPFLVIYVCHPEHREGLNSETHISEDT